MAIVSIKCPNCGANGKINDGNRAGICEYCGAAFVVEDAVNTYNTSIQTVENLSADVVNIVDDSSSTRRLEAAEAFMKLGEYNSAEKAFLEVTQLTPQDARGWWGIVRAQTFDFLKETHPCCLEQYSPWVRSALEMATGEQRSTMERTYQEYCNVQRQRSAKIIDELTKKLKEYDYLHEKILEIDKRTREWNDPTGKSYNTVSIISGIVCGAGLIFGPGLYIKLIFIAAFFVIQAIEYIIAGTVDGHNKKMRKKNNNEIKEKYGKAIAERDALRKELEQARQDAYESSQYPPSLQ